MSPRRALVPIVAALGLAAACAGTPPPEPLAVGGQLPPAVLEDQFGNEHRIDASLKLILLSRDMDGGRVVREVLAEHPASLQRLDAVYVADISGMPGVIASMMAIPKMRERAYPTLLDREGTVTAAYPSAQGKATVIALDAGRIESIEMIGDVEAMKARLGVPPGG